MKNLSKKLTSRWTCKKPLYVDKKDKRYTRYTKQLKNNGFSDTETWALDVVISEFILPRLIRFKEVTNGYPGNMTEEKWNAILDQMIFAFEWRVNCESEKYEKLTKEEFDTNWLRYEVGMNQFREHFMNLGW